MRVSTVGELVENLTIVKFLLSVQLLKWGPILFRRRRQVPSALSRLAVMDAQSSLCCAFLMASA